MSDVSDNDAMQRAAREEAETYRGGARRPLAGYVLLMAVFSALVGGTAGLAFATGRRLPSELSALDLLLLTVGTHKLARTISKDSVTSPLRSPFTQFEESGAPAEVNEQVRKPTQITHAIGELITCPFCLGLWTATGFSIGMVFAPRLTRLIAATFSVSAGADFLQFAYTRMQPSE